MADRVIAVPLSGGGPAAYQLRDAEAFTLRSVTWRQLVGLPVDAADPAIPQVRCYSPEGVLVGVISAPAIVVSAPTVPAAPTLLSAFGRFQVVDMLWDPPASDGGSPVTGYNIYRGLVSGGETLLVANHPTQGYADGAVVDNTTYFYQVSAVNAFGEGPLSNELSATPNGIMFVTFDVFSPANPLPPAQTFPVALVTSNNPVVQPSFGPFGNRQASFQSGAHTQHATLVLDAVPAGGITFFSSVAPSWTSSLGGPPLPFSAVGTYTFDITFGQGAVLWFELGPPNGAECAGSFELRYD